MRTARSPLIFVWSAIIFSLAGCGISLPAGSDGGAGSTGNPGAGGTGGMTSGGTGGRGGAGPDAGLDGSGAGGANGGTGGRGGNSGAGGMLVDGTGGAAGAKAGVGGAGVGGAGAGGKGMGGTGAGGAGVGGATGVGGMLGSVGGAGGLSGTGGTGGTGGGCATGFVDCNGLSIDGCETDIRNDPKHCGGCTSPCATGALCMQQTCAGPLVAEPVGLVTNPNQLQLGRAALAVDHSDVPYAAFITEGFDGAADHWRLWPLKRTGTGTWTAQVAPLALTTGTNLVGLSEPGLAVGPNGDICYAIQDLSQVPCNPSAGIGCVSAVLSGCLGSQTTTTLAMPAINSTNGSPNRAMWNQLAIDPLGTPIVAYGPTASYTGVRVIYKTDDPVDSAGGGIAMSIHQDATGAIKISYLSQTTNHPTYASWNGTTWTTSVIDSTAISSSDCLSMVLDGSGAPHVLYSDQTSKRLLLATFNGSTWTASPVRSLAVGETGIGACALALDGGGVPHIFYVIQSNVATSTSVNYAIYNGSGWSTAVTAGGAYFVMGALARLLPEHVEMVLNAAGKPHILVSATLNTHFLITAASDYGAYYLYLP